MTDITLDRYIILGSAAERAAFTPVPGTSGPGAYLLPIWVENDTGDAYYWDETAGPAAWVAWPGGSGITELTGDVTAGPGSGSQAAALAPAYKTRVVTLALDGGGVDITTGAKKAILFPEDGTITSWTILSDDAAFTAGDIEFDVFLDDYASYPPTTSIVASAPPALSGVNQDTDATLTGWTTAVTAGDVFGFEVVSCSGITSCTLEITVEVAA